MSRETDSSADFAAARSRRRRFGWVRKIILGSVLATGSSLYGLVMQTLEIAP